MDYMKTTSDTSLIMTDGQKQEEIMDDFCDFDRLP